MYGVSTENVMTYRMVRTVTLHVVFLLIAANRKVRISEMAELFQSSERNWNAR